MDKSMYISICKLKYTVNGFFCITNSEAILNQYSEGLLRSEIVIFYSYRDAHIQNEW